MGDGGIKYLPHIVDKLFPVLLIIGF